MQVGKVTLAFDETSMLAHDGTGKEVDCTKGPITLHVRSADTQSPDVNADGVVNIFDFSIVSGQMFLPYTAHYDLNTDGRVDLSDVQIIISGMTRE
jgi:hypothetical protein